MPNWKKRLDLSDVFHNDALPFEQKREAIVQRLRLAHLGPTATALIDAIEHTSDVDTFDEQFDRLYDWADQGHQLWIVTRRYRPTMAQENHA